MGKNDPYHGGLVWDHINKKCKKGCPYCRIAELEADNQRLRKDIRNALLCDTVVQMSECLQTALEGE